MNRLQRLPSDVMAALLDSLGEGVVLAHERVRLALGHGADLLLLIVNQAEVLHDDLPNRGGIVCGHQIVHRVIRQYSPVKFLIYRHHRREARRVLRSTVLLPVMLYAYSTSVSR